MTRRLGHILALAAAMAGLLQIPAHAQGQPAYPRNYRLAPSALPEPGGRHGVGSVSFVVSVEGQAPLRVVAWYPAARLAGPGQPYLDSAEQRVQAPAIERNFHWPAGTLDRMKVLPTHARPGARIAPGRFPLVIYSHGYFSYARQNTSLMERLASEGYIVLSLVHPGDSADVPTADGVIPFDPQPNQKLPDPAAMAGFLDGRDHAARIAALPKFWEALQGGRMLASLNRWTTDIRHLADAVEKRRLPREARFLAASADMQRLAYVGMSFGGSASASACEFDRRCRAAINLDGFELDRRLYDRKLRMPLLLIQSDWTVYPNMGPPSRDTTIYDYAYEPWASAGSMSAVYRFRIADAKHLAFTDLVLAPREPVRDRIFGPVNGEAMTAAVNDLVTTFLDRHVSSRSGDVVAAASRHPGIARHTAAHLAEEHRHLPAH